MARKSRKATKGNEERPAAVETLVVCQEPFKDEPFTPEEVKGDEALIEAGEREIKRWKERLIWVVRYLPPGRLRGDTESYHKTLAGAVAMWERLEQHGATRPRIQQTRLADVPWLSLDLTLA